MPKSIRYYGILSLAIVASLFSWSGCDSTTNATVTQSVVNIAWLPDESGMIAVIDKQTVSTIDNSTTITRALYRVGLDGSIGNAIGLGEQSRVSPYGFSPLAISSDGSFIIGQMGANIYRVNLGDNTKTELVHATNLLGVSPDMKYVLTTTFYPNDLAPLYRIYDVAVNPPLLVGRGFTPTSVVSTSGRALWLDGVRFALTYSDTASYEHVSICDISGTALMSIPNSEATNVHGAYAPQTQELFVRNRAGGIDRINLQTNLRDSIVELGGFESMDASQDGKLVTFTSSDTLAPYNLLAVNTSNRHSATIASDAITPFISPRGDRVAYIHRADPNQDIKVIGVSIPQ